MKIGLLTSSRADYGIYKPLIKELNGNDSFTLKLIAFGTHLSPYHGYTIKNILADDIDVDFEINSLLLGDDENSIATSCALTSLKFADFWKAHRKSFDLVFCLGDRFEMFAAVVAAVPFGVKFAHLFGGETTLGAIDNIYRHMITLASEFHFVSLEEYGHKVASITGRNDNIYTIGSLSLDNIADLQLLSCKEFNEKWNIDLKVPTVLITVHPETVASDMNEFYIKEFIEIAEELTKEYQLVITMPNSDTFGSIYRKEFEALARRKEKIKLIENFGTQSYFTCMKYSRFLIGNTSSGITEASTFNKYVINIGDRQKGRLTGPNVLHVPFNKGEILNTINQVRNLGEYTGDNIYYRGGATQTIINVLQDLKMKGI